MGCQECEKHKLKKEILRNTLLLLWGGIAVLGYWGLAIVSVLSGIIASVIPVQGFVLLVFPIVVGFWFGLIGGCSVVVQMRDIGLEINALEAKLKRMK